MTEYEIGYREGYEAAIKELFYVIAQSCEDLMANPTDTQEYRTRQTLSQWRIIDRLAKEMEDD